MKCPCALATGLALFACGSLSAQNRLVNGFPDLPKDARAVAERSVACQHFWGEVNGTHDERDEEVARAIRQLKCHRVVRDLELMRSKHSNDPKLIQILREAEAE